MRYFKKAKVPEGSKHPNPYLQLHLLVYPSYLEEQNAGTYDPGKDPFCSSEYILAHHFRTLADVGREVERLKKKHSRRSR